MDDKNKDLEKDINTPEDDFVPESNAAHRIRMRGEMEPEEELPELKINKWQNFWFHHKVKVIMISIFAFILLVATTQYASRKNPDVYILYAGPDYITANENKSFCESLAKIMDDYNGDGRKLAQLTDFIFMTDSQVEEYYAECEEADEDPFFDLFANNQTSEKYSYEIFGGNASICILAEDQYLEIRAAGGFIPLSELFAETPEGAYDEYGVRLTETKFYKYYGTANMFPEDCVIAIRKLSTMSALTGRKAGEKKHAYQVDMFKRLINFEYPEGYTPAK